MVKGAATKFSLGDVFVGTQTHLTQNLVYPRQGCNLWRNSVRLPPFCSQPVATLAGYQQRPECWRTEVLDFCTGSHKPSSFTRRKSRTSNNPIPVLRIPSKFGWMRCSLNESNLTRLRHKLHPCSSDFGYFILNIFEMRNCNSCEEMQSY